MYIYEKENSVYCLLPFDLHQVMLDASIHKILKSEEKIGQLKQ